MSEQPSDPVEHLAAAADTLAVTARAPHNPHQQLIPAVANPADALTATELVEAARSIPALVTAVATIAARYETLATNIDALNRGLADFKREIVEPFREELHNLRYSTGDRLNHFATDLERAVNTLERVLTLAGGRIERAARPEAYTDKANETGV
jgi:hypothetical protein